MTGPVDQVGVIGAGTMGIGVAHLFAAARIPAVLVDVDAAALTRAAAQIRHHARMYRMLDKSLAGSTPDEVLELITFSTDIEAVSQAGFVVENVTERWEVKAPVYRSLAEVTGPGCVLAVNTSAIPITHVAGACTRPERVVGTHFMNPAPLKPLVEVIRGVHTSEATIAATRALLTRAGRESIVVNDSSGFVTNRIAMLMVNEAAFLLQEGVSSAPDVDRLFRRCFGHPMGPLETADLIGLDTVLYSLQVLLDYFNDPKFRPAPLLRQLVSAGRLGRKSGRGFYPYETVESRPGVED